MLRVLALGVAALILAPVGAHAADLVVWWEKGFYPQEDEAIAEVITAFEQETGRQIELVQPEQDEIFDKARAAIAAENPPGFLFGQLSERYVPRWAYEGSFWCDRVQPAVREALGRNDVWAVGLPMSTVAPDTGDELLQFQLAYETPWLDTDRRPRIDDPTVHVGLVKALKAYTAIWRKGCTPPDSTSWGNTSNNKAFLAQTVVMTVNPSLSIPAALRTARPDDYHRNAATIDWPDGANGQPLVVDGGVLRAVVFKDAGNPALAGDFVRFLAEEGWLAHWLDFAGDRIMPPMRKLVEQPFWLDPTDPHRMRAAIQILTRPHLMNMDVRDQERQSGPIWDENVWGNAVHRVVAEGITPEQAVDDAIARIKQILAE